MSANITRSRQDELERERRIAELTPFLVPGWQINRGNFQVQPIKTALGFYQRGQEMLLRCRREDCKRRVEIDFRAVIRAGLGDRPPLHLLHLLRCQHWSGCQLEEAHAIYPKGVPLVSYLNHSDVLIAIACLGCRARLLLSPKAVIERLIASGGGDGSTGVLELGKIVRGPCSKCGGRRFESDVKWAKAPGSG